MPGEGISRNFISVADNLKKTAKSFPRCGIPFLWFHIRDLPRGLSRSSPEGPSCLLLAVGCRSTSLFPMRLKETRWDKSSTGLPPPPSSLP